MKGALASTALAAVAALSLVPGVARAADPTTADCLAASDASLKAGNEHRLRAERSQLLVCAAASCPADIRRDCVSRVEQVNAQIPTIIFAAKDASGADLSAVKVTMDGDLLADRLQGTGMSIDPGEHTFKFESADHLTVTRKFVIVQGQKDRRELILFGAPGGVPATAPVSAPPPAAAPPPSAPPAPASAPPVTEPSHGLGGQKTVALVAGAVGVVGVGVGTVFGLMAMSQKNDAQALCPADKCTTQEGVSKWSDAGSTGNISTIGFVAGGVLLAGAAVLWFTAPSGSATTQVGLGPTGMQIRGVW